VTPPPLTWLYVPADRSDRVEKALSSAAHAVIVDLEDAVLPAAKDDARASVARLLREPRGRRVHVRVNGFGTPWHEQDVELVASLPVDGINLPKVESVELLDGLPGVLDANCLIESARGVEAAFEIASHPRVAGIALGEADLAGETGQSGSGLDWARSRIVNAAVAAGLPRPPQSIYARIDDLEGLEASCARGRELGFLGRTALHPKQLPVIERAYLPTESEAIRARGLVERFDASGSGAYADEGGFVDVAIVRAARAVVALADAYGTAR
jgi:citrate lyase subunit beta/citryl-CoA lyase